MLKPQTLPRILLAAALAALAAGCVNQTIKSTAVTPVESPALLVPERLLLDVGVMIFDPGLEERGNEEMRYPEVRRAESRYMPFLLAAAIRSSGAWGAVRVIPDAEQSVDLRVHSTILLSHGEELKLKVEAKDATGATWLRKRYDGKASRHSYGAVRSAFDPFQGVYNEIANDLLRAQQRKKAKDLAKIRQVTEMRFAAGFSPEAFGGHIKATRSGKYRIRRLPAENDPMLERIRSIRAHDLLFIDTLQEYYGTFQTRMHGPYQEWRKMSYEEAVALRELRAESWRNLVAGVAAVAAGIAAVAEGDNSTTRTAGTVAVLGGGALVKSGLDKRQEAEIHVQALEELSQSLETEIAPQIIELEDRSITLTGSVEQQYEQWRELLREIYEAETGNLARLGEGG